tara:strand:+ start:14108 stop:14386 length:279 start_codon:yes stop_codon:yes gene_type:complete
MNESHQDMQFDDEIVRLRTENGLLRAASEEQRELNGELRATLRLSTDSLTALTAFLHWFNTWGILLEGGAYTEAAEIVEQYKSLHNIHEEAT